MRESKKNEKKREKRNVGFSVFAESKRGTRTMLPNGPLGTVLMCSSLRSFFKIFCHVNFFSWNESVFFNLVAI